jgi:WD40 repeat protein
MLDVQSKNETSSKVETSHMASTRARRVKADAERKAQVQLERDRETQIKVMDHGEDRTPMPLLKQGEGEAAGKGIAKRGANASNSKSGESRSEQSLLESSASSDQYGSSTEDDSGIGDSSGSHSLERSSSVSVSVDQRKSSVSEGVSDDTASRRPKDAEKAAAKAVAEKPKEWTAEEKRAWMNSEVTITLSETPVVMLFSHHDEVACREKPEEILSVTKANERYAEMCEAKRKDEGTRFQEKGMTTLLNPKKAITSQIHPPATKPSGGIHVTPWKLHDEFTKLTEEEAEADDSAKRDTDGEGGEAAESGEAGQEGDAEGEAAAGGDGSGRKAAWVYAESLLPNLLIMERAVVQNNFEELQLGYRGLVQEPLKDHLPPKNTAKDFATPKPQRRGEFATFREEDDKKREEEEKRPQVVQRPKMKVLWRYGNEITSGKNVSCMAWNKRNHDILATGYGEYGIPHPDKKYSGLICCWSLKNPVAPERVIQLESEAGVSALSFSNQHASLLAVGNTDGTLALYDVRKHGNAPALKTTVSTGQHTGTIWEVKWVERGKGRGENLISISADGRVLEWSMKKGLERTAPDLMKLKRMPNKNHDGPGDGGHGGGAKVGKAAATSHKEALLSRQSGGMCFDINPKEAITYVVGTEDGTIHKCSKSQSENYILDYKPHEEPVYRIRWSPFCSNYFLTCSADWTSRLYDVDRADPVIKIDSNRQDAVHDVAWSCTNATIFGAATAQGRVDIWDVADPLQPRATLELENRSLNCLLFAEQESPVVVVGDNCGDVTVIKLTGAEFERNGLSDRDQEDRFQEVVRKMTV